MCGSLSRSSMYYPKQVLTSHFSQRLLGNAGCLYSESNLQESPVSPSLQVLNRRGMCQGILYLSSAFSFWSVWLTVTFTAERCFAVQCPLWRLQLGTRGRARVTVGVTVLASLVFNAYLLVLTDVIVEEGGTPECEARPEFEQVLYYTNIMDTVVTLIVPFILIVIMNFMIGRALYLFTSRRRLQRLNSSQLDTTGMDVAGKTDKGKRTGKWT
ncbi:pyrokinin-1 receptor [Ixodes scapularis]